MTEAEYEKVIAGLKQDLLNERRMWKAAVALVLSEPQNIGLVGDPAKPNEVRETLRPIAELVVSYEQLTDLVFIKQGTGD